MKMQLEPDAVVSSQFLRDWRLQPPRSLSLKYLAACLLLAFIYFVGAKLALMLALFHPSASPVWPPTGIAFAALLLLGYRVWPAIFVGAFLVNLTTAGTVATSLAIAIGNTAEALAGAYLVNRFAGGLKVFDQPQSIFRFAVLAGLLSTALSATVGVTTLSVAGFAAWPNYGSIWLTWWLGDAAGNLIVAPVLVLLTVTPRLFRWDRSKFLEALGLGGGLVLSGWIAFGPIASVDSPIKYLCIPFLIWAAFRFGQWEAAVAVLLLSGVGISSLLYGHDFLGAAIANKSLLIVEGYFGVMSVMTMSVAAVVAERKRAEEALRKDREDLQGRVASDALGLAVASEQVRQSEAMLKRAQQIAHIGSFQWDAVANRVTWSDEMYRIYGLAPAEFDGTLDAFLARVHPDDCADVRAAVERAVRERKPFRLRERIVRSNGEIRVLDSWGEVVLDSSGEVLALQGVCRDITEDDKAERTLQDLAGRLIRAQEEERSRIGRELHDHVSQRAGLLSIKLDEIRTNPSIEGPALSEHLSELSERVNDLTRDIHSVSRRLHSSTLEYLGLMPALQHLVAEFSAQRSIQIEFSADSAPAELPPDIALCLYRVVEESLHNSVKHSGARSARVALDASERGVLLVVEDKGAGFDPATLNGKAGLGLISMRERLRLVQGILRIHSAPARGTRVEAWIPSTSLLLVEDNPGDAAILRRMVREMEEHFRVTHVNCLAHGLDRLREGGIDIILLDLGLPDSVGLDTLSRIRTHAPNIPIIVISGQSDRETARLALRQGAQGFIPKEEMNAQRLEQLSRTILSKTPFGAGGKQAVPSAGVGAT